MKTKISFALILLAAVITITSCKKKEQQPPANASSLSITLSATNTTTNVGGNTPITASVSGANGIVSYTWSVNTSSTITGSGSQVSLYASCPSCTGPNKVTCKATDANNNTVSKDITITVQ